MKREEGSPWNPALPEHKRAARLEGRKIVTRVLIGSRVGESFYRVDRYRRFLDGRGSDGRGIVQFWGPRATRTYLVDDGAPDWNKVAERALQTVAIGDIVSLKR